jgi:hypothetical protein
MWYKEISFDFSDDTVVDEGKILADYIKCQIKGFDANYLGIAYIGIAMESDKQELNRFVFQDLLIISGELLPLYYFVFEQLSKTEGFRIDDRFDPRFYYGKGFIFVHSSMGNEMAA